MSGEWLHAYPAACCEAWPGAGDGPCACHRPAAPDEIAAGLAVEIAAAQFGRAALRLAAVAEQVRQGDVTQEYLRVRRAALETAAIAYCLAGGEWPPAGTAWCTTSLPPTAHGRPLGPRWSRPPGGCIIVNRFCARAA